MKMLLIEKIATLENLILSWRKVENSLKKGEIWFDELDAFDFKLNLIQNLENMGNDMLHGKYRMQKILPKERKIDACLELWQPSWANILERYRK